MMLPVRQRILSHCASRHDRLEGCVRRAATVSAVPAADSHDASATMTTISPSHGETMPTKRGVQFSSPKLAAIIRAGIGNLNESASWIQRSARTQAPLYVLNTTREATITPRQSYEANRILEIAHECIEHSTLQKQSELHPLVCSTGDPITLLACRVNPPCSDATLYWSLPYSVLSQLDTVQEQRILERIMAERLATDASARVLQQRVQAMAAMGQRRLQVQWELAPAQDIQEYLYTMESDALDDDDDDEEEDDEEAGLDGGVDEEDDDGDRASKRYRKPKSYRSKYTS